MPELLYSHPGGHFERHPGAEVLLMTNGQVLVVDAEGSSTSYLEWSGVEQMISSLVSGAEALDVEIAAPGFSQLEVVTDTGRLIGTDRCFHLAVSAGALSIGGEALVLTSTSGDVEVLLRGGDWWLPGERLGKLTVRGIGVFAELPLLTPPGNRSRVSELAERAQTLAMSSA